MKRPSLSFLAVLSCLTAGSLAYSCKARNLASKEKHIYKQDLPDAPLDRRQRYYNVEPKGYPFVIAFNNCTAFILDKEVGIGMTAYHCAPPLKKRFCMLAKGRHFAVPADANEAIRVKDSENCPIEGQISGIIEEQLLGELDYIIFKYEYVSSLPSAELRNAEIAKWKSDLLDVKLLANKELLSQMKDNQTWIFMTGYPGDKYAQKKLTNSTCKIKSGIGYQQYFTNSKDFWQCLIKEWDTKDFKYKVDPVEYKEMRRCFWQLSDKHKERFQYDCSVYGGNSGGPIYYQDPVSRSPIVIGHPNTYAPEVAKPDPSAVSNVPAIDPIQACLNKYKDKFFTPTGCVKPAQAVYTLQDFDSYDRSGSEHPWAVPMTEIVKQSKFLKENPNYLFGVERTSDQIQDTLDYLLDPKTADSQGVIDDLLEAK